MGSASRNATVQIVYLGRGMIYLGACLIAGIRLAREKQVNVRVIPTSQAIDESVELAHEIYYRIFREVPEGETDLMIEVDLARVFSWKFEGRSVFMGMSQNAMA